jgi:tetratricopeptide (TPR) repeat protein
MTALCVALLAWTALAQPSPNVEAAKQRALELMAGGKPAEAVAVLQAAVASSPADADVRVALGDALVAAADAGAGGGNPKAKERDLLAAEAEYKRAQALSPATADLVSLSLLTVYDRDHLNRPRAAEPLLRAIVATRPGTPLYHVLLARSLIDQQRLPEAAAVLDTARPRVDADSRLFLATITAQVVMETPAMAPVDQRRLLQGVVTMADEVIARKDDDLRDALKVKSVAQLLQAERTAATDADRAKLKAQGDATFDQFYALAPKADYGPPAVDAEEAAITRAVGEFASHLEAGRTRDADAALARAMAAHGKHPVFWSQLAQAYTSRQDWRAAVAAMEKAAEAEPANPERHHTVATYYWDIAYRDKTLSTEAKRKHIAAGLAAEDKALALNPDYMEALVYKGILLKMQADMETDPARKQALQAQSDAAKAKGAALLKQRQ